MAHYAFLDENNIVVEVISGIDETELIEGLDPETWYGQFRGLTCKRTSYNTHGGESSTGQPYRKNYAGIGYSYDHARDAFIPPKPGGNYILNENTCLWVKAPEIGITDGDPIIAADGVDFVTVYIAGGAANSTEVVMVNNELLDISTDADGYGEFELSSETTVLLVIAWNNISLEVAAI